MNRPHLRWCDYDNEGNILPMGYKRLKDGTIVNTEFDKLAKDVSYLHQDSITKSDTQL